MKVKRIVVLGSTGSIGRQTLEIIENNPRQYALLGIAAYQSVELLAKQAKQFKPSVLAIGQAEQEPALLDCLGGQYQGEIYTGVSGINHLASLPEADVVIQAMSGAIGIVPTVYALQAGKNVGLANKETMVAAGDLVRQLLMVKGKILPIDSEHAAIAQCLEGKPPSEVRNLWLTCSGGPFRTASDEFMQSVTPGDALKHPKWNMGPKITVDSATLMNKGLEIIEAHHLFSQPYDKIKTVIHPQSIIHSIVEFNML
jgi:1-deoxy-D-xylulose-5-phosphate reductoisomerase